MANAGTAYVVGCGIAGLAAGLSLSRSGYRVVLHEATARPGGRLYSWHDRLLDRTLDNGLHWIFSGQSTIMDFLTETGVADSLDGPDEAGLEFVDLADNTRWRLRPNAGVLPWWVFDTTRNAASTGLDDVVRMARLLAAPKGAPLMQFVDPRSDSYRRFWEPMTIATLNTPVEKASAEALARACLDYLPLGGSGLRVRFPKTSLTDSFIAPAVNTLARRGACFSFRSALRHVEGTPERLETLHFSNGVTRLEAGDVVVLAVPPQNLVRLLPDLSIPVDYHAIISGHFRSPETGNGIRIACLLDERPIWVQVRGGIVSATVGAADDLTGKPIGAIAVSLWHALARGLELRSGPLPAHRIVKERRGVISHSPENVHRRPPEKTSRHNLVLAGDWTRTGTPASIESAIHSGRLAAAVVLET